MTSATIGISCHSLEIVLQYLAPIPQQSEISCHSTAIGSQYLAPTSKSYYYLTPTHKSTAKGGRPGKHTSACAEWCAQGLFFMQVPKRAEGYDTTSVWDVNLNSIVRRFIFHGTNSSKNLPHDERVGHDKNSPRRSFHHEFT